MCFPVHRRPKQLAAECASAMVGKSANFLAENQLRAKLMFNCTTCYDIYPVAFTEEISVYYSSVACR